MAETDPHVDEKPADPKRRGELAHKILIGMGERGKTTVVSEALDIHVDDLPQIIRQVYSTLANVGRHPPGSEPDEDYAFPEHAPSPEEEEETAQIYHRIDRELAVEEARADRLLQLYAR
jgi:hypothetical protein